MRCIALAAMIGVLAAPAVGAAESPSVLLQKGIYAEETEGNLDAAIQILAYVDWETGDVAIRDLNTGLNRRLTNKGSWAWAEFGLFPLISPDGKEVAYCWWNRDAAFDLRWMSVEEAKPRVLNDRRLAWCQPDDWSADGKQLVAQIVDEQTAGTALVVLTPEQGGMRTVKVLPVSEYSTVRSSPDGRFLVYARPSMEEPDKDLFLLNVADGTERPLIQHPADEAVLGWTPDGGILLFSSDRRGSRDAWAVQVHNGKTNGEPYLVKTDLGEVYPIGFARDGRFFYGISRSGGGICRARLDWETGKVIAPPVRLPLRSGQAVGNFSVSPDSRGVVFLAGSPPRWSLRFFHLETRRDRELASLAGYQTIERPQWLSDGRAITLWGHRHNGSLDFLLLDTITGQTTAVIRGDPDRAAQWWHRAGIESRSVTYVRWDATQSGFFVVQRDLSNGTEQRRLLRKESDPYARYSFFVNAKEKTVDFVRIPPSPSEGDPGLYARFDLKTGTTREWLKLPCYFQRRAYFNDPSALALGDPSRIAVVASETKGTTVKLLDFTEGQASVRWTVPLPNRATVGDWVPGGRDLAILRPGPEAKRPPSFGCFRRSRASCGRPNSRYPVSSGGIPAAPRVRRTASCFSGWVNPGSRRFGSWRTPWLVAPRRPRDSK